MEDSW